LADLPEKAGIMMAWNVPNVAPSTGADDEDDDPTIAGSQAAADAEARYNVE